MAIAERILASRAVLLASLLAASTCVADVVQPIVRIVYSPSLDAAWVAPRGGKVEQKWKSELASRIGEFKALWQAEGPELIKASSPAVLLYLYFGLPVAYLFMCLLGLPYVLWLASRSWLDAFRVCIGAALIGTVAMVYMALPNVPAISAILVGAALGLMCGIVFCLSVGCGFFRLAK